MEPESSLPHSRVPSTCPHPDAARPSFVGHTEVSVRILGLVREQSLTRYFYGGKLLAPRPNTKLEDHLLSAFRDCLFNILAATLHIGGRSSIVNLRTLHALVTGTHSSLTLIKLCPVINVLKFLKVINYVKHGNKINIYKVKTKNNN